MSFQADDKARSRKLTNAAAQVVGSGTSHVLDELTYDAADKIHHVTFQFRGYFPGLTSDDLPSHFTVRVNDGFAEPCTHTLRDYYVLGFGVASCSDPITKIEFAVSAKADKHFTLPGGSVIHYGAQPNEATPDAGIIANPPAVVAAPVTEYFFMGFGSHWSMGHDTSAGHVTKFTERIALINATLPANEHWTLASPSTVDKTNDMLNFFDNQITALQNHPSADSNGKISSELLTSSSWTGGNFSAGVSPPIYQGHPILINLTRDGSGDWSFGDGVPLALSSDRWENATESSDNAIMWGHGGEWGSDAKFPNAGKFKIEPATKLRLYAIFERTV